MSFGACLVPLLLRDLDAACDREIEPYCVRGSVTYRNECRRLRDIDRWSLPFAEHRVVSFYNQIHVPMPEDVLLFVEGMRLRTIAKERWKVIKIDHPPLYKPYPRLQLDEHYRSLTGFNSLFADPLVPTPFAEHGRPMSESWQRRGTVIPHPAFQRARMARERAVFLRAQLLRWCVPQAWCMFLPLDVLVLIGSFYSAGITPRNAAPLFRHPSYRTHSFIQ